MRSLTVAAPDQEPLYVIGFDPMYPDENLQHVVVENGQLFARCPSEAHARAIVQAAKQQRAMLLSEPRVVLAAGVWN